MEKNAVVFNSLLFILVIMFLSIAPRSNADLKYSLLFKNGTLQGNRTIGNKIVHFNFKVEEEDGLVLLTQRLIAKHLGDKFRANSHPFSFATPEQIYISVQVPSSYFVFSSFRVVEGQYQPKKVSQFVVGVAKKELWVKTRFEYMGTNFELVSPKKNAHIDPNHWEKSVKRIWKAFVEQFGCPADQLVFVDLNGPISGGPLGGNVLAIFATENMNPTFQSDMRANLGWEPKPTTKAYVETYYPKSSNPWEEYMFGTFAHEIGHLFFGFGLTREHVKNADDLWFSLGLGMIYDMDVTNKLIGRMPQLELDIIKSWSDKYAHLTDIDQRLVNPNKAGDKKYPFDRKKVFAHGKSAYFLARVREKIGVVLFDAAVREYIGT